MRRSRIGVLAGAVLLAAVVAFAFGGSSLASLLTPRLADFPERAKPGVEVDVELVLAVDISYSMDFEELELQREGYVQALQSPEFVNAVREGLNGRIAVTYVEWAGIATQHVIMPWRIIDGPASAAAVARDIAQGPTRRARRTSISGALRFSAGLFDESGYKGIRRVIDVSGDGTNNDGPLVTITRDAVLAKGITINGLPIMLKRPNTFTLDIGDLDIYYEDCVIGGPGAFVVPVRERHEFISSIRKKLLLEIAARPPEPSVMPAQARAPRVSCTIGERMWQERWGRDDWR